MDAASAVRTEGLTQRFGNAAALGGLNPMVERVEEFGFPGPNGVGNHTQISAATGALHEGALSLLDDHIRQWVVDAIHTDRGTAPRSSTSSPSRAAASRA